VRGKQARVGELVDGALRRWNLERGIREQRALLLWPTLVGDEIARNTVATAVKDHVLLVSASNHAWAQTLDLMKVEVLKRVRERLGQDVVRDVHFSAGRTRRKASDTPARPQPAPEPIVLGAEDRGLIEQATGSITDPALREHAARAFASLIGARRRLEKRGYRACPGCGKMFQGKGRRCEKCATRRPKKG